MPKAEQARATTCSSDRSTRTLARAGCVQRHDPDPIVLRTLFHTVPCPMRAIPVPVIYPLSLFVSLCVCVLCVSIFCALSFARQETHIETQAETSFPLWRDIALHLHTEGNRSGSLTRSSNHHHYHQQPPPPPVLSASTSASARHLPAGVPLASHREKVYFMNSHKYWDWVLEIRPGRPLAAIWHRDLGVH